MAVGADAVEVDVRLSRDGVPVLHHDPDLRRTCGRTERVADLDAEELGALVFRGDKPGQEGGGGVPTLERVLDVIDGRTVLDLELKETESPAHADRLVECVARLVRDYRVEEQVLVSSFDPALLERMRARAPSLPLGRLVDPERDRPHRVRPLAQQVGASFLGLAVDDVRGGRLEEAVDTGLPVFVFTVDDEALARELHRRGAAGVFTNAPDRMLDALERE